jgi:hypothetical protein
VKLLRCRLQESCLLLLAQLLLDIMAAWSCCTQTVE